MISSKTPTISMSYTLSYIAATAVPFQLPTIKASSRTLLWLESPWPWSNIPRNQRTEKKVINKTRDRMVRIDNEAVETRNWFTTASKGRTRLVIVALAMIC